VSWIAANRDRWKPSDAILLCVSGRGDKDVSQVSERLELTT
jgi:tryptophan synthase beta subunit